MRFSLSALIIGLAAPVSTFAASGDTTIVNGWSLPVPAVVTFSGGTLEQKLILLNERLGSRAITDVAPLIVSAKAVLAERSRAEHDQERHEAAMEECRNQLRKANRDGKFFVTLRCVRTLLLQDLAQLRKRESALSTRTDVSTEARTLAVAVAEQATDAIVTVVNAIDTGVYDGIEDLEEMKQRLYQQYRVHDLRSDLLLRIDRHRLWAAYLTGRMHVLSEHQTMHFIAVRRDLDATALCLWNALNILDAAETLPPEHLVETASMIRVYEYSVPACIDQFQAVTSLLVKERLPPKSSKETQN